MLVFANHGTHVCMLLFISHEIIEILSETFNCVSMCLHTHSFESCHAQCMDVSLFREYNSFTLWPHVMHVVMNVTGVIHDAFQIVSFYKLSEMLCTQFTSFFLRLCLVWIYGFNVLSCRFETCFIQSWCICADMCLCMVLKCEFAKDLIV